MPRTAAPVATAMPKGPRAVEHGRDRALRSLERILHELADALAEPFDGFRLLLEGLFGFLGCLERERFARSLLLHRDHLLVGFGDRVDGLRLAVVSLQELIPLRDQPVHAALAIRLGLLFERRNQPLDTGPGLIRNPDHLPVRRFCLLLEAIQAGVGLVHNWADLILGFEDYALCLVCHITLP